MTKPQAIELAQCIEELIFTTVKDVTGMRREKALTQLAIALVAATKPPGEQPAFRADLERAE